MRLLTAVLVCITVFGSKARAQEAAPENLPAVVYVTPVTPPAIWEQIYHEVEQCLGHTGDFAGIRWFVTSTAWRGPNGRADGLWMARADGRRDIVVARGDTAVVRHEIVHDLLWHRGPHDERAATSSEVHPVPPFGRCAKEYE